MGLAAVTSAASRPRIARAPDLLNAWRPAEEVLIIGATLGAANELTRGLAQEKRATFGYHRLTLGQLVQRFGGSNHIRSHSGAPRSGEPGIHNHRPRLWISGLAAFGRAPE